MHKYFLTIDNGGTNTKVVIFDEVGKQIAVSAFPTKGLQPHSGFHEINLNKLWQDLQVAIKDVLQKAQLQGEDISGIATVGHGKGLYLLDKAQKPFTNGILSADSRAESQAHQLEENVSQIFEISHQHIMPSQAPVILKWLKEHDSNTYQNIGSVLSNKDFTGFLLTGEVKQELGDASGNNFVNLTSREYDSRLFDFFGIPEMISKMPPLIRATDIRGRITTKVAAETGLKTGTPVYGGMFDIDACAVATGVLSEERFSVIAGTWNMNIFPSKKMAGIKSGLMNSIFPTDRYLVEASSPTSAGNLAIILKMLMTAEMRDAHDAHRSIYDNLEAFLKNTDATFSKVFFFPFLYGSNADSDAEGTFIGIRSNTTKSELIRAVYEGIVFAHRYHNEALIKVLGKKPKTIRMSGGACNSSSWVQMFADILQVPIEIVSATELGGLGGAIASAVGSGYYQTIEEAVTNMSTVTRQFLPNKQQSKIYDQKYAVYKKLLESLEGSWSFLRETQELLEKKG